MAFRTRDRPECKLDSNEALQQISCSVPSSESIVGNKDEAIAPMSAP